MPHRGSPNGYGPRVYPDSKGQQRKSAGFQPEKILRRPLARPGVISHHERSCRRKGCGFRDRADDATEARCPRCDFKFWIAPLGRPLRFHDLRHTAASLLLEASAGLHAVQLILRHRHPQTTMRLHAHLQQDYRAKEKPRIAAGFFWRSGRDSKSS